MTPMQDAKKIHFLLYFAIGAFIVSVFVGVIIRKTSEEYIRKYDDIIKEYQQREKALLELKNRNDSIIVNLKSQYDSLSQVKQKTKIIYHEKLVYINSYTVYQLDSLIRAGFKK